MPKFSADVSMQLITSLIAVMAERDPSFIPSMEASLHAALAAAEEDQVEPIKAALMVVDGGD